jgi:hypothetical protein
VGNRAGREGSAPPEVLGAREGRPRETAGCTLSHGSSQVRVPPVYHRLGIVGILPLLGHRRVSKLRAINTGVRFDSHRPYQNIPFQINANSLRVFCLRVLLARNWPSASSCLMDFHLVSSTRVQLEWRRGEQI